MWSSFHEEIRYGACDILLCRALVLLLVTQGSASCRETMPLLSLLWILVSYFGVPFKVRFLCRDVLVSCFLALPHGFHVEPLGSLDSLAPSGEPAGVNRFHSSSHNTSIMCVRSSTFHDGDGGGNCICSSCTLSFGGIRPSYVISHMWASSVG